MALDTFNRHRIALFGGEDADGNKLNDFWELPVNYWGMEPDANNQWLEISLGGSPEARLPPISRSIRGRSDSAG